MNLNKIALAGLCTLSSLSSFAYPEIYPFVPVETKYIHERAQFLSEDEHFIKNIYDSYVAGLSRAKTHEQPWMSTYWPLNKGLIADPYKPTLNPIYLRRELDWKHNYNRYLKRKRKIHPWVKNMSSGQLAVLAPSEKYDLLLGDDTFNLTNVIWVYQHKWGSKKEYGFLSSLNIVGGGAMALAEEMVSNGQYESLDLALPAAIELRGGLTEYLAQDLVEEGKYENLVEALPEAEELAAEVAGLDENGNSPRYVLKRKNSLMATWEGICHGWATASGVLPRPLHKVDFDLGNGKFLRFLPDDIKALSSLLWANSTIQDNKWLNDKGENMGGGVMMQGLRCNQKSPATDHFGRYYDDAPDQYSGKWEPRCVGVHPALWHMALVNIIGKQGRSFIVERKVKAPVDNHPLSAYRAEYFNPYTGDYAPLISAIKNFDPKKDQFQESRNPDTAMLVGVRMVMTYIDWGRPKRYFNDSPSMDKKEHITMLYDLELDIDGNIIGGQWRATEVGEPTIGGKRTQPDFFWVITKDWKPFFKERTDIAEWTDTTVPPPADWKDAAKAAHEFQYQQTNEFGWNEKCDVIDRQTGELIKMPCEFKVNRPQPLVNVVYKLLELSRTTEE